MTSTNAGTNAVRASAIFLIFARPFFIYLLRVSWFFFAPFCLHPSITRFVWETFIGISGFEHCALNLASVQSSQ